MRSNPLFEVLLLLEGEWEQPVRVFIGLRGEYTIED
jgi:hypothetical protein